MSVEGKGEAEGKVVSPCTGSLEGRNVKGSGERRGAFALLGCPSSSLPPQGVCNEGVRKQLPLIGNRDTQLSGRMVGDPQRMREVIPTQAGHTELCGRSHAGCKAAPTHTSPRTHPPGTRAQSQSSLCQMFGAAGSKIKGGKQNGWGWPWHLRS